MMIHVVISDDYFLLPPVQILRGGFHTPAFFHLKNTVFVAKVCVRGQKKAGVPLLFLFLAGGDVLSLN